MVTIKQGTILSGQSMAASFESDPIDVLHFKIISISWVATGAPVGTLKIQVSNDTEEGPTIWDDLADSDHAISAADHDTYIIDAVGYSFIKLVYTYTSGSGTFGAKYTEKE